MPKCKSMLRTGRAGSSLTQHNEVSVGSNPDPRSVIKTLRNLFSKHQDPGKARQQEKYMRDQFKFFGVYTPDRRHLAKQDLDSSSLWYLIDLCWEEPEREFQYFACDVAIKHKQSLCGVTPQHTLTSIRKVEKLITTKSWWDTVDMLASNGHFVLEHSAELLPVMEDWINSSNMWLRRSAIIHQLPYKIKANEATLFRFCLTCCHEKEFFIQKAIGWALREHHKTNPTSVEAFVHDNKSRLSPLSVREALKHSNTS